MSDDSAKPNQDRGWFVMEPEKFQSLLDEGLNLAEALTKAQSLGYLAEDKPVADA